ncbi:MAG: hypothetical protein LBU37_14485 [Tannerellaceae bacterium]|jgi:hypothetical protein|nr:hypothetical protein [Tannerellaceae bacterium]
MAQLTIDRITEIYCIADDFCREFSKEIKKCQMPPYDGKRYRNRSFVMSDAEIITIMICFHCGSFRNLKHFYLFYIGKHLRSESPNLLFYNRFVELERKVMIPFALFLKLIEAFVFNLPAQPSPGCEGDYIFPVWFDISHIFKGQQRKASREPKASEDLERMARPDRREGHAPLPPPWLNGTTLALTRN